MDYYYKIQNAIEFIELNLNENIGITEIASKACFSAFHFQRLFQAISGFSVQGYIRRSKFFVISMSISLVNTGYFSFSCS